MLEAGSMHPIATCFHGDIRQWKARNYLQNFSQVQSSDTFEALVDHSLILQVLKLTFVELKKVNNESSSEESNKNARR